MSIVIENHKNSNRKIKLNTILIWTIQATQGLQVLHSNKIIHRDIKPANIFLDKNNRVKLGDLGIAKILENTIRNSEKFTNIGTFQYMSPEILNEQQYSYNTDVWSMGCVVYELIFFKCAFPKKILERNVENLEFEYSILTGLIKK